MEGPVIEAEIPELDSYYASLAPRPHIAGAQDGANLVTFAPLVTTAKRHYDLKAQLN